MRCDVVRRRSVPHRCVGLPGGVARAHACSGVAGRLFRGSPRRSGVVVGRRRPYRVDLPPIFQPATRARAERRGRPAVTRKALSPPRPGPFVAPVRVAREGRAARSTAVGRRSLPSPPVLLRRSLFGLPTSAAAHSHRGGAVRLRVGRRNSRQQPARPLCVVKTIFSRSRRQHAVAAPVYHPRLFLHRSACITHTEAKVVTFLLRPAKILKLRPTVIETQFFT